VLWQNANADLPGCHTYRKGENDRSLITSDKQNPTAQPGTDCQIEFRLIQTLPRVASEMALHLLAYNLTRVMNIMGIQPLMAAIRA
jgi:hypothetical protein